MDREKSQDLELRMICEALKNPRSSSEGVGYLIDGLKIIWGGDIDSEKYKQEIGFLTGQLKDYMSGDRSDVFTKRALWKYLAERGNK